MAGGGWISETDVNNKFNDRAIKSHNIALFIGGWDTTTKQQTVNVKDVVANETAQTILIMPAQRFIAAYKDFGIQCVGQGDGTLTFSYSTSERPSIPVIGLFVTIIPVEFS